MLDVLDAVHLDAGIRYFWTPLEREIAPSPRLIELMEQFGGQKAFEVYSVQIFGRQGKSSGRPFLESRSPTIQPAKSD